MDQAGMSVPGGFLVIVKGPTVRWGRSPSDCPRTNTASGVWQNDASTDRSSYVAITARRQIKLPA